MDAQQFLGLERRDERTWRLTVTDRLITPGQFLFGGCGLAAGLVALEGASGRPTVWATAQYLSYAPRGAEVVVTTDLAVTGGHVSQARAVATVDSREILTINAALGTGTLSTPAPWTTMPDVPDPEECPPRLMPRGLGTSIFEHVESRVALGRTFADLDGTSGDPHSAIWARVPGHFDPSAATLAIFGDYVSGGVSQPLGRRTMGRSLDNTIRIATLEPTEWVLCDIHMHALAGGFAQGTAFLWSRSGTLLATASQSIAARLWDQSDPPTGAATGVD
ncbi:MAG: acyl-CoA thioesterase [Acidimicrobiales bacterium]